MGNNMTWHAVRKIGTVGGVTLALCAVALVAIIVNVLLLVPGKHRAFLGMTSENGFIALYNADNSELLASNHQQKRYGLFEAMGEHSNGVTILGPTTEYPTITTLKSFTQRAYGLARVDSVIASDYDPQKITSDLDKDFIVAEGPYTAEVSSNWERSGYRVFAADTSVSFFVYALKGDTDVFIDLRLLEAKDIKAVIQ
jgi:hypothetical protein